MITRDGEMMYTAFPAGGYNGLWGQQYPSRMGGAPYIHRGLDINNYGNAYAAGTWGRVVPFTNNGNFNGYGAFGLGVCLDHGIGKYRYTLFAHNSQLLVAVGDEVGPETLIAISGATGDVTGGHIHIQRQVDTLFSTNLSDSADPLRYLEDDMLPISFRVLTSVAWGDGQRMLNSYAALRQAGFLLDNGVDYGDDLNAYMVKRGQLAELAVSDDAAAAYEVIK